ncbi:tripartite tricarboxylate transporter substrate binding protein [Verticiella sediminum]|uniref:Tripartite tricarboxylate transporter substrate binding protein n=1 Tax=Verticiella sediminum TaxID=1247510 RepID=A0A556ACS0_9BURK|nr:tripartite tricarboxylate transporter substrate binding protein [Verticiella sediminum]TSH90670.1 tripartite tricarboxylate transporter substrate binding protein [Verticiella sediminum]
MSVTSRTRVALAAALTVGAFASGSAALAADSYPSRPIRMIVPYAPGGGPDVLARKASDLLAKELGATVVVENKVGAGGMLAGEFAARAPADGYTVLLGSSSHVTQKVLQPSLNFDPVKDFVHVTRTGFSPSVLVVTIDSPIQDVQGLIEAAKAAPAPLQFASGGIGSAAHLSAAAFSQVAGIQTSHIPYRGSVEIVPALLRGDVQFAFPVSSTALPQIANGKVRPLAVTSAERLPTLPEVPTLNEVFQREDLALDSWGGAWVPAGTPPDVVAKLFAAFRKVYSQPDVIAFNEQVGTLVSLSESPEEFTRFVEAETAKYRKIITDSKIEIQQ